MAKKVINYEEDIFFLNLLVKGLKDGLKLDIDPGFFATKITQDIAFIMDIIGQIYTSLRENNFMLKRMEYLKNLQRLMQQFQQLLDEIVAKKQLFSTALEDSIPEYRSMSHSLKGDIRRIKSMLTEVGTEKRDQENIVSQEEFKFLMSSDEEA